MGVFLLVRQTVKLTVFIDGACEPRNPGGYGACGFAVFPGVVGGRKEDPRPEPVKLAASLIGEGPGMTNNVAEYRALRGTLNWLLENGHASDELHLHMDSELVVNQVKGSWRCLSVTLAPLLAECRDLMAKFDHVALSWVPRVENFVPDDLVNQLYSSRGIAIRRGRPF